MRILVFDHLTVNEAYLTPYKLLADVYGHELLVVRPDHWFEYNQKIFLTDKTYGSLKVISSKIFFPNKFNRLIYRFSVSKIKDFDPDVVYSNSEPENFSSLHFSLLRMLFLKKTPLIIVSWRNIQHTITEHPYKFGFIYLLIEKITLKYASAMIGFNDDAVRIFKQKSFSNIRYIPMGVDLNMFRSKTPSSNKRADKFTIGFIGRFEKPKGVQLLIKALSLLKGEFACVLVGDGPCKQWYIEMAEELNISERIIILDGVTHTQIPEILQSFDVLVLPSLTTKKWIEQFGRVLIEAMASGVPVIGSSSGEIPKVIADAGLVFQEGNVEQLKTCIQRIYDDPDLRKQLINNGIKRVDENYSWEVVARKWDAIFKEVSAR